MLQRGALGFADQERLPGKLVPRRSPNATMPAPTVWFVKRSMMMNEPVLRFCSYGSKRDRRAGRKIAERDVVEAKRLRGEMLARVDIDLVLDAP